MQLHSHTHTHVTINQHPSCCCCCCTCADTSIPGTLPGRKGKGRTDLRRIMILWFVLLMFQSCLHRFGAAAEHVDLERIETCSTRCSQVTSSSWSYEQFLCLWLRRLQWLLLAVVVRLTLKGVVRMRRSSAKVLVPCRRWEAHVPGSVCSVQHLFNHWLRTPKQPQSQTFPSSHKTNKHTSPLHAVYCRLQLQTKHVPAKFPHHCCRDFQILNNRALRKKSRKVWRNRHPAHLDKVIKIKYSKNTVIQWKLH